MVVGLSKVFPPEGVFKACVLGKHHQEPFNSGKAWTTHNPLEMIHIDVCFINIPSLESVRYILIFIDDFSHFTWVFFLKRKNIFFENFKEFWSFDEKQFGQPIKLLRLENGGEYVNLPFE
jgi:hypothetical protein